MSSRTLLHDTDVTRNRHDNNQRILKRSDSNVEFYTTPDMCYAVIGWLTDIYDVNKIVIIRLGVSIMA